MAITTSILESRLSRYFIGSAHKDLTRAKELLRIRQEALDSAHPAFYEATSKVIQVFRDATDLEQGPEELKPGSTRSIYSHLFASQKENSWLWPHLPLNAPEELVKSPYFKFFCLVMNKYKTKADNGEIAPRIRLGRINGKSIPYSLHTHVDLEVFINLLGLGEKPFTHLLGEGHDLQEEGLIFGRNHELVAVDPKYLIDKFSEENIGLKLAIGIPILTESEYEIMGKAIPGIGSYKDHPAVNKVFIEALTNYYNQENYIKQIVLENPFKFGGLAVQIKKAVEKLITSSSLKLNKDELLELANSIVSVELTDRMSDMSDIERIVEKYGKKYPGYSRFSTIYYACRMLNMYEKLTSSIELLKANDFYKEAKETYLDILEVKITDVNEKLKGIGEKPISTDELFTFYKDTFKPMQEIADKMADSFIEEKTNEILAPIF